MMSQLWGPVKSFVLLIMIRDRQTSQVCIYIRSPKQPVKILNNSYFLMFLSLMFTKAPVVNSNILKHYYNSKQ